MDRQGPLSAEDLQDIARLRMVVADPLDHGFHFRWLAEHAPATLVEVIETTTAPRDTAALNVLFERYFVTLIEDEYDVLPQPSLRSFTPALFTRLLCAVQLPLGAAHHRYKALVTVQMWLYDWIARPFDVQETLRLFDTVPWMEDFKKNMKRLQVYDDDEYLAAVTTWMLPSWQTQPDYIDRLLSSNLILFPKAPCWPVLAGDTALYAVIEANRHRNHHSWRQERHEELWETLRDIRRRRHWAAFKAVWCGCAMWRLYTLWALHPDRLHIASSALARATAPTRAVLAAADPDTTSEEAVASLPERFRLLDVARYFDA